MAHGVASHGREGTECQTQEPGLHRGPSGTTDGFSSVEVRGDSGRGWRGPQLGDWGGGWKRREGGRLKGGAVDAGGGADAGAAAPAPSCVARGALMVCEIPTSFSLDKSKHEVGTGSEQRVSRRLSLDAPMPNTLGQGAQSQALGHKGAGPVRRTGRQSCGLESSGAVGEDAVVPEGRSQGGPMSGGGGRGAEPQPGAWAPISVTR